MLVSKGSWRVAFIWSLVCLANCKDLPTEGSADLSSSKAVVTDDVKSQRTGKQLPVPFLSRHNASPYVIPPPYANPYARQGLPTPYAYQQPFQPSAYDYQQLQYQQLQTLLATSASNQYHSMFSGASHAGLPTAPNSYSPPQLTAPQQPVQAFVLIPENIEEYLLLRQLSQGGGSYVFAPSSNSKKPGDQSSPADAQARTKFLSTLSPAAASDVEGRFFINNWNQLLPTFTFDPNTNSFTYSKPNILSQAFPISARVASFADGADVGGTAATVTGQAFFFQEAFNKEIYTAITFVGVDTTAALRYNVEIFSSNNVGTANCAGTGTVFNSGGLTGVIATNIPAPTGTAGVLSIVQRTPISAMTLHGTFAAIGRSVVLREVTTGGAAGVRVACGAIAFL